jgi:hypothetical protein
VENRVHVSRRLFGVDQAMPILSRKAVEEADGAATEGGGWGAADEGTLSDGQGTIVELAELGAKEKRPLVRFVFLVLVRSRS